MFRFQQFTIHDDRCSMKVGTDGVLLGAWAKVEDANRILDIGSGSGLIALMCAQRSSAAIIGIEVESDAVIQSQENVAASPFQDRIQIIHSDIRTFTTEDKYDCIVSNPPYFEETILPLSYKRALARHTAGLSFASLITQADRLLTPQGSFHVVLPYTAVTSFNELALTHTFIISRFATIITKQGKAPRRALLSFTKAPLQIPNIQEENICIYDEEGQRTSSFRALTNDFYLY